MLAVRYMYCCMSTTQWQPGTNHNRMRVHASRLAKIQGGTVTVHRHHTPDLARQLGLRCARVLSFHVCGDGLTYELICV